MTITRIRQTGFETNSFWWEVDGIWHSGTGYNYTISTVNKTGTYSMALYKVMCVYYMFPATDQVRISVYSKLPSATHSVPISVCRLFSTAGLATASMLGGIRWTGTSLNYDMVTGNATLVDTYANGAKIGVWQHLGIDFKRHATTGWFYFYLDGIEVMSFEGNTGSVDIGGFLIGNYASPTYVGAWHYFDDLTIDDSAGEASPSKLEDRRYILLKPNGAGNYTNWIPSAGNNYECVDEIPPAGGDYVSAPSTGLLDSYALEDLALPPGADIKAVISQAIIMKESANQLQIKLGTRLSSTDLLGSAQNVPSAYGVGWPEERQITKPGGGDWADSDVDAAEVIIESAGTYT